MGTYGRYSVACEALACFLQQTRLFEASLLIFNQHPAPLHFDHPHVRVVNEPFPSATIRTIRNRMLELADADAEFIHFWDDDDLYLPWHLDDCIAHIGRSVAWKPARSWMRSPERQYSLTSNAFEGSWMLRADYARAAPLHTHADYIDHPMFHHVVDDKLLATTDLGGQASYIYRWSGHWGHVSSHGGQHSEAQQIANLEKSRTLLKDTGRDGRLVPADLSAHWSEFLAGTRDLISTDDWEKNRERLGAHGGRANEPRPAPVSEPAREPARAGYDRRIAAVLVQGADPANDTLTSATGLKSDDLQALVVQAAAHGVLPAVVRGLQFLDPISREFDSVLSDASARVRLLTAHSMMLRGFADVLLADLKDEPVALVKGLTFARSIYPQVRMRPFTDIDLLIAPDAKPRVEAVLQSHGFVSADDAPSPERSEDKWLHKDNSTLLVEVHTNMVHAQSLQGTVSLTFEDLNSVGVDTPPAHLMVAAMHAAMHQFETLRQIVDIVQAARHLTSAGDEQKLECLVARTGGRLAVVAGLDLGWRLFGERRCVDIADALSPVRHRHLTRLLINRDVLLSMTTSQRVFYSWRRLGFRELLKRGDPPEGRQPCSDKPTIKETAR